MQTLRALDLTQLSEADGFWRPRRLPDFFCKDVSKLPADGFSSPLGFWFAASASWGTISAPLLLQVFDPAEEDQWTYDGNDGSTHTDRMRRPFQARVKLDDNEAKASSSPSLLRIELAEYTARITVAAASWSSVSDVVLIIVAQYWRFLAISRLLDELADWVHSDLRRSGFVNLIRRHRSRLLEVHRRKLQALILDLPDFELYLTNPKAGLPPGRSMQLYRGLVRQLGLNGQRRVIDERVEVIEAILDSSTESLNHLKALTFQIVLELAIVALLFLDVGLYLWDSISQ
jgi:hypothetical protein